MFIPYEFYRNFMVDYFLFKQATYKNILDNFEEAQPIVLKDVTEYLKEDYFKSIKSSIRITYFHSIETLFELIFAIEGGIREEVNEHKDETILARLANSNFRKNFERIARIAEGDENELSKWDELFQFESMNEKISLLRYTFYYIINPSNTKIDKAYWDKMPASLDVIKNTLILFAKDFSDRKEYNAYKHGLRILPMKRNLRVYDNDNKKEIFNMDFSDSSTFIYRDKKEFSIITKGFDTQRDFNMTVIASEFMASMINIRKNVYFNKTDEKMTVKFFEQDKIDGLSKINITARDLKITWNE